MTAPTTPTKDDLARYRANRQEEVDSAYLYHILAECEPDARLADVYRRLEATEETHAKFWETQLRQAGAPVPLSAPSWRKRVLGMLARRFGARLVLPTGHGGRAGRPDGLRRPARDEPDRHAGARALTCAAAGRRW